MTPPVTPGEAAYAMVYTILSVGVLGAIAGGLALLAYAVIHKARKR